MRRATFPAWRPRSCCCRRVPPPPLPRQRTPPRRGGGGGGAGCPPLPLSPVSHRRARPAGFRQRRLRAGRRLSSLPHRPQSRAEAGGGRAPALHCCALYCSAVRCSAPRPARGPRADARAALRVCARECAWLRAALCTPLCACACVRAHTWLCVLAGCFSSPREVSCWVYPGFPLRAFPGCGEKGVFAVGPFEAGAVLVPLPACCPCCLPWALVLCSRVLLGCWCSGLYEEVLLSPGQSWVQGASCVLAQVPKWVQAEQNPLCTVELKLLLPAARSKSALCSMLVKQTGNWWHFALCPPEDQMLKTPAVAWEVNAIPPIFAVTSKTNGAWDGTSQVDNEDRSFQRELEVILLHCWNGAELRCDCSLCSIGPDCRVQHSTSQVLLQKADLVRLVQGCC